MHEMAIAQELLRIAEESAYANNKRRLTSVTVHCGQLSGVMPEALRMAFDCLIAQTPHAGAMLHIVPVPLKLKCPFCNHVFAGKDASSIYGPCPACGEEFAHIVEEGRELLLAGIEAGD